VGFSKNIPEKCQLPGYNYFKRLIFNLQEDLMKLLEKISIILFVVLLFGCASGSTIITGETKPAIDPTEVKIYIDPPSQYETVGLVEASSEVGFTKQAAQDRVMNELKTRAAKVGANGVLLVNTGTVTNNSGVFSVNDFFYSTVFYSSRNEKITAQGRAIFVAAQGDGD
jgi:uncharacterized protein YbjQ (UPF0145 family)